MKLNEIEYEMEMYWKRLCEKRKECLELEYTIAHLEKEREKLKETE
jgi:hypothetical protein